MSKNKFDVNVHYVREPLGRGNKSKLIETIFMDNTHLENNMESNIQFQQIPIDQITPRSINKYAQTRIDRLAKSIKATNNRLIHPITIVRVEDLSEESDVIQKFKNQGVDISTLKYILVSGERRFRAWQLLREEEKEKLEGTIGLINKFDTITANVLTREEAKKEEVFYDDSNIESRQLTSTEAMTIIKKALVEAVELIDSIIE